MYTKYEQAFRRRSSRYNRYLVMRRFLKYVTIGDEDECWEWQGRTDGDGYGWFVWPDKKICLAHIAAYVLFVGKIPSRHGKKKLCVCHSCDNPSCINPTHLWLGTNKQNIRDMIDKGRKHDTHGENNPSAKLTLEQIEEIRKLYKKGHISQYRLADKFNVTQGLISYITSGKVWKN